MRSPPLRAAAITFFVAIISTDQHSVVNCVRVKTALE